MLEPPATLDDTLADAFGRLSRGVADRRSAFHTPTVATIGADGTPELRTVVLRRFDAAARTLAFHSDARSAKMVQLLADPRLAMHFYDAGAKVQLRLGGRATVHRGDAEARTAWDAAQPNARDTYRIAPAPGSALGRPTDADPHAFAQDAAFAHFAWVAMHVTRLEWLYLAASGHRRALFTWTEAGPAATWLAP